MKMKILHLEDNEKKHAIIQAVLQKMLDVEIDWVTDVTSGIAKIEEAMDANTPYDVANDWRKELNDLFMEIARRKEVRNELLHQRLTFISQSSAAI